MGTDTEPKRHGATTDPGGSHHEHHEHHQHDHDHHHKHDHQHDHQHEHDHDHDHDHQHHQHHRHQDAPPLDDVTMDDVLKSQLLRTKGLIDGKWIDGHAAKTFPVVDPATQQEITQVAAMDKQDVELAIQAAVHAQLEWKQRPPLLRAELLKSWYQQILVAKDELARIASAESGKPLSESLNEVVYAASFVDFYASACLQPCGFVVPSTTLDQRVVAVHEPVGVCAIITPWNFPLAMVTRKLAPCLAAGCTAIVRPASETPLSALALAELACKAGFPDGVVNVVVSPHESSHEIGHALATSDAIRKLSFTGSTRVGQLLMQQSAANVKKLSLELGGNAPFIVFEDADLDAACAGLLATKFRNTGQTCVCSNRVFVHASVFEAFLHKLVPRVQQLQLGSPFALSTQLGPLINAKTFDKVQSIVQDAVDRGASVVTGGKPATEHGGLFYEPTVLVDVDQHMRVFRDEIFGPVVPLFPFDSEHEVVSKANDTIAGLAGYLYTRDVARAWRVAGALECGMVGVNTGAISSAQAPFGGVKQSGIGREGSMLGLDEYVETKLISMGGILA